MAEHSLITLLVVDHSAAVAEQVAQILRDAGHDVQKPLISAKKSDIKNAIEYKPVSLILVRQDEGLPGIDSIRRRLEAAEKTLPVLAVLDAFDGQQVAAALQSGADNFCVLQDPSHLTAVVKKELDQAHIRRKASSLATRLQEVEARCDELLQHSRDAIAIVHEGAHFLVNPAYQTLFGFASTDEMQGLPLMNLIHQDDHDKFKRFLREVTRTGSGTEPLQVRTLKHDGEEFLSQVEGRLTRMNDEPCLQISVAGPSQPSADQDQQMQQQIKELSKFEPVTGLYNRKYFTEYLDEMRAQRSGGAVLYILLSDYRAISEQLGLEAIDHLASELAELIKGLVGEEAVVARFSDAVFTAYTPEVTRKTLAKLGETICAAIKEHTSHAGGRLITTAACIGICLLRASHKSATQILINADRACESARQKGGNQAQLYSPSTSTTGMAPEEGQLLLKLKDAISQQRLELHFQPIASFMGETTERYKAFLRILDESNHPLKMDKLMPLAESRNLMRPLDKWVISRAMEIIAERYQLGHTSTVLFIAISANSIVDEGFCPWLGQSLSDTGLTGDRLVLEVTEDTAEQYFKQMQAFRQRLQSLQCGLALSHFGGKPNSQRLMQHLHPDYIKLDGTLIEQLAKGKDENSRANMTMITEQAQAERTQIVAASVSNAAQMAGIWQFGVTLVQGNMVQEASPIMEFDFQQFSG